MASDELTESLDLGFGRFNRCTDGSDIATDDYRDVSTSELFLADHIDRSGLARRVDRFENGREALGFDKA